jgi:hypothetical protein
MVISGGFNIGSSGRSVAGSEADSENHSDDESFFTSTPTSQADYTDKLVDLPAVTADEKEIKWDDDVPQEARRHAFQ